MYQIILKDGELTGEYSSKKSPSLVAKAIMRVIYQKTGARTKDIRFKNLENGKEYSYKGRIIELERPTNIIINGKKFLKKYQIFVERI